MLYRVFSLLKNQKVEHIQTLYTINEIHIFPHNNRFPLMEIKSSNLFQHRSQYISFLVSVGELCKAFTSFLAVV